MLVHNSEDTCKTMSLHIRRFNASLYTHQSTNNVNKSQSSNRFSPSVSYLKVYKCTTPNTSSPGSSPASTTAAWAHLRALRDTGNTCHGSPDLGEGSSRDHKCTTCPWNDKRKRQDYGCTCMCGDSRGCPMSCGDKQAIRVTHRVHAEL